MKGYFLGCFYMYMLQNFHYKMYGHVRVQSFEYFYFQLYLHISLCFQSDPNFVILIALKLQLGQLPTILTKDIQNSDLQLSKECPAKQATLCIFQLLGFLSNYVPSKLRTFLPSPVHEIKEYVHNFTPSQDFDKHISKPVTRSNKVELCS